MDCLEAQEKILESLEGVLAAADQGRLQHHLSGCDSCVRFAAAQRVLDCRLAESIQPPALSPGFGAGLRARLRPHPRGQWAMWLPDAAYLAGAAVALTLCAVVLPLPPAAVLPVGAGLAIVGYAVQVIFVGVLEEAAG